MDVRTQALVCLMVARISDHLVRQYDPQLQPHMATSFICSSIAPLDQKMCRAARWGWRSAYIQRDLAVPQVPLDPLQILEHARAQLVLLQENDRVLAMIKATNVHLIFALNLKGSFDFMEQSRSSSAQSWLNRTVLGIALASLFSDWSHEIATAVLPAFLGSLGVAAAWLGIIEGISDGLSSFAKLGSGFYTDGLPRRKPIALVGYLITALATASIGLATTAGHVLMARATAWLGRGIRTPVRKALLTSAVDRAVYGRAFGFERAMDTLGAIIGPLSALWLLAVFPGQYRLGFFAYPRKKV